MTDKERVAKRMFEAYSRKTLYGRPWNETPKSVKEVWLMIAEEAIAEIKEIGKSNG